MIAYVEPIAGASGDMILGALLDAGLALADLTAALRTMPLPDWRIDLEPVTRGALGATLARVITQETDPPARHLGEVLRIIEAGALPGTAAERAGTIFKRMAEAEAHVHRTSVEAIHFHEVGAADAILDICAAATGLVLLDVEELYCAPLPLGGGSILSTHGPLPLPAPATLELLARAHAPSVPHPSQQELVTPTGAAILTTLARFEQPAMRIRAAGYGAGSRQTPEPNLLRITLGEPLAAPHGSAEEETLSVIECNLDDMNPQWYGHIFELLLERGALDVTATPTLMKKGRPGQILSVLCRTDAISPLSRLLLAETTTLGVRHYPVRRQAAARVLVPVDTRFGPVTVKLRVIDGVVTQATPEYDECRALARALGVPLAAVSMAATVVATSMLGQAPPDNEAAKQKVGRT